VILMVVGVGGYLYSGMASPTALIPAAFGMVISMLGYYGRREQTSRTALYLALGIAVAGVFGSVRGLLALPTLLSGGVVDRPTAVVSQSIMAVVLVYYVIRGLRTLRS